MQMPGSIETLVGAVSPDLGKDEEDEASRPSLTRKLLSALNQPNLRGDQAARIVEVIAKINPIPEGTALKLEEMSNEELLALCSAEIAAVIRLYGHDIKQELRSKAQAELEDKAEVGRRPRKMNHQKARELRERWVTTSVKASQLAKEYDIHEATVSQILSNKTFKDPLWKRPTKAERRALIIDSERTKSSGKTAPSAQSSATSTALSET